MSDISATASRHSWLRAPSVVFASAVTLICATPLATGGEMRGAAGETVVASIRTGQGAGHLVTTSVTRLDLTALKASAFGDAEETQ